jgi:hypothetical protein
VHKKRPGKNSLTLISAFNTSLSTELVRMVQLNYRGDSEIKVIKRPYPKRTAQQIADQLVL